MKLLVLFLILLGSFSAFAGEVVLMTSLKLSNRNVRHLEKKFTKAFRDSGHSLVIHHKADPKILYGVMTSENTEAVIWVSHAAGEQELKPGFKAEDIPMDVGRLDGVDRLLTPGHDGTDGFFIARFRAT